MDLDDFRSILDTAGVDVWLFIDTAITVASLDCGDELRRRRDGIIERIFAATTPPLPCRNCDGDRNLRSNGHQIKKRLSPSPSPQRQHSHHQQRRGGRGAAAAVSPSTPQSLGDDDDNGHADADAAEDDREDLDPYGGLFDDEQKKILEIKEQLEEPDQSEESLVELLQNLADMDITFQALKETDIGRHVNRLRKHSSNDVRRLVKLLVRKWKEIVDEWVRLNQPGGTASLMADGDSPPLKTTQNGHHQIPDFAYSPNPHNGSSGSDRNTSEAEPKPKVIPRKEAPPKPTPPPSVPTPSIAFQNRQREQRDRDFDAERLASARKRLQENYKEAENAKKQRTIQVMDIHELPKSKPKNAFFGKNKGSGGSQGRHW
ncbi:probable mediator of RNA polymerase II transcription subunit 26c [Arachis stenosperma]|uniref:probable mediator of RNA polymerase II transcription subunit 26c n=1 Tax=Arachis stenosperma TaxID=217475 RepID=UPI0025AD6FC3|nr:probable mediator of RNA polymerase II transcription subunit 26c [Arachis stenosperma]